MSRIAPTSCPYTDIAVDIVKKQAEQNAREYDRLATEFNSANGNVSNKKAD